MGVSLQRTSPALMFLAIVLLDQATKLGVIYMFERMDYYVVEVIPSFNLILTINHGISFGMLDSLSDQTILILMDTVIILIVLLFAVRYAKSHNEAQLLIIVAAGGTSNMLDRILHDGVIDFLDFYISKYHFPAFNVADAFISIALVFILINSICKEPQ